MFVDEIGVGFVEGFSSVFEMCLYSGNGGEVFFEDWWFGVLGMGNIFVDVVGDVLDLEVQGEYVFGEMSFGKVGGVGVLFGFVEDGLERFDDFFGDCDDMVGQSEGSYVG